MSSCIGGTARREPKSGLEKATVLNRIGTEAGSGLGKEGGMGQISPATTADVQRTGELARHLWLRVRGFSARRMVTLGAILLALTLVTSASADDNANYQISDGLGVYLGLMPAAIIGDEHPPGHAEADMHGGPPTDAHAYHIILAVFDAASGERVENAAVTAVVSGIGNVATTNLALEPMLINSTVTYGAFVDLGALERFDIAFAIAVPGESDPVQVSFTNEHVP